MTLDRRGVLAGGLALGLPVSLFGAAQAGTRVQDIAIRGFTFEPSEISVKIGDQIRVTNHDLAPHTATAKDESWDSGTLAQGESSVLTVTDSWSEAFYCRHHPNMTGTLRIE